MAEHAHAPGSPVLPEPIRSRARRRLRTVVRAGLALAAVLMSAGFVVAALAGGRLARDPAASDVPRPESIEWLLTLGVLVLVASPALQVLGLAVVWIRERDWKYVVAAVLVLGTLGAAVALGSR